MTRREPLGRGYIDSDRFSLKLREKLVMIRERKVLLANLVGSAQSTDRYTQTNASGIGRVREFTAYSMHLSRARRIDGRPIAMLRGHPPTDVLRSQVFQLAGCNWRCWYCFVDDKLLAANRIYGRYSTADDILDAYLSVQDRPRVIDLSGGQPDLVPEWCLWLMQAVEDRGLKGEILIWQDDNLSNSLIWDLLSPEEVRYIASFPGHSRVGCFKGFDPESFSFNTLAPPELYERQFVLLERLLRDRFDVYAYATFTGPLGRCNRESMRRFVDRLQQIHRNLPLRTVPLEVRAFTVTATRMNQSHEESIQEQFRAGAFWDEALLERFSPAELTTPYEHISLAG